MYNIQNPFANMTPVVKNLLIINIIFFIATWALGSAGINLEKILSAYYPDAANFKLWQIISYMFMHANIMHILSNMLGLVFIGPLLEHTFGAKRFLQYYFITGIGALLIQFGVQAFEVYQITGHLVNPDLRYATAENPGALMNYGMPQAAKLYAIYKDGILGASGAIFGLMIAIFLLYPDVQIYIYFIPIPVKIKYVVPVYVLYELYAGFRPSAGDDIAHFAHIGGALVGFIVIKLWGYSRRNNFY